MTIDEAIKIQEDYLENPYSVQPELVKYAIKLGIEALKRIRENRHYALPQIPRLLPGETK